MLLKQGQRLALLFSGIISLQLLVGIGSLLFSQLAGEDFFAQSFTLYSVTFWLSALLMTFLVSRHFYHQVKDKQVAQLAALESATASKQAQEELLKLQQENQEQLEVRVQERTLELNIALQELESANHELAEKNTIDDLSGLYNRRHYDQKILAEYRRSKRNLTPLSLVIIDIDHFKRVNDDYGHQMGDHCIASVGRYIKQCLRRSSDLGFRYGGEEFCLLLPETDSAGAQALAEELRLAISNELITHQQQQLSLTISCGVSTYQQQKEIDPESLFAAADKALYKAKHNGRNQTQIESPTESLNYQEQINE
jgi:diguanylate cyclase (GGDEF)-like protein